MQAPIPTYDLIALDRAARAERARVIAAMFRAGAQWLGARLAMTLARRTA